jgi:hypothetical protein
MQTAVNRLGADELLTTREVVRDFMDVLHTLHQNPEVTYTQLLGERAAKPQETVKGADASANTDDLDDFLAEFEL